jgi:hypothetical protein
MKNHGHRQPKPAHLPNRQRPSGNRHGHHAELCNRYIVRLRVHTEEIETIDALRAPDREQFITAIQKEIHTLIDETGTLVPIHRNSDGGYNENEANKRTWKIRTTLKCKCKKKANGEPDKHKARGAVRGDTLRRAMIKAEVQLPTTYSPASLSREIQRLTTALPANSFYKFQ